MTGSPVQPSHAGTVGWPAEVARRYVANGYWEGQPLTAAVRDAARRTPDATALVDGDVRLSYAELMAMADGAALRLLELGLRPDDRLVVQLPNSWEFAVLTLACLRAGVLPVMALPAHRRHELGYLVAHAQARAIAVPDMVRDFDHQAMAHEVAAGAETLEHVLVVGEPGGVRADSVDLRALLAPATDPVAAAATLDAAAPDSRSVALFLLSGGTTGLPKLIARSHDDYAYYVRRCVDVCRFDGSTVYLLVLPLGHSFPLGGVLATLRAGGTVVVAPSPAPEKVFRAIERERVTTIAAVPAIAQRWLEYRRGGAGEDISSLVSVLVGGARLPDEIAQQVGPTLGCVLQQGYGMAEGLINLTRLDDPDEVVCHTQGRPISPDDELMLVDADGRPSAPGEPGVLLTRGPCTPRGYYLAPEQNARSFTEDGWFRTGDIVRLRPDGYLVVEGRDKDMINRAGEKISAEEVENFAYQVTGVSAAAAVAMPHPELGEQVCLYLVTAPGVTVLLEQVVAVMERAGVARFKVPERLVVVDALPLTPIGKTDKKALRADIEARLACERADRPDAA
jgi:2-hydroxy-7-methoxy-5-methyl-1-naphthoate---CoA ligase